MHALIWLVDGFLVAALGRGLMRRRGYGPASALILGGIGGVVAGWAFRTLAPSRSGDTSLNAIASILGAAGVLAVAAGIRTRARDAGGRRGGGPPPLDLERQIRELSDLEERLLDKMQDREQALRNPSAAFERQRDFGQRLADRVAAWGGSWTFIGIFLLLMLVWMAVNAESRRPFDPFPFILLNLALSCLAALQAPIIMMSQNRMATKDRLDAHHDYCVNLRAELEIQALHQKLEDWTELVTLQRRQLELLETISRRLEGRERAAPPDDRAPA